MLKKIILLTIVINLIACQSAPFRPPVIETTRVINLTLDQVVDRLAKHLPDYLLSTSRTIPDIEKKEKIVDGRGEELSFLVKDFSPPHNLGECTIDTNMLFDPNKYNGMNRGLLRITLSPIHETSTQVEIISHFHENHHIKVPGNITGYIGGYSAQDVAWIDKGSHCYSNGTIEKSIFALIHP